jgi:hypothetical protein
MQHLNEEQLVLHRYHDDVDDVTVIEGHLAVCAECRAQYDTLCRVLTLVDELPVPQRGDQYGTEVWNRLRWRLGRRERVRTWQSIIAIAAVIAIAFFAGQLWHARHAATAIPTSTMASKTPAAAQPNRLLLVVVSDHLDSSERMLLEVSNADAKLGLNVSTERKRAEELVSANRLYRQTALQRGETRIASVLSDIEPVLLELAHSDAILSPDELASLQKRIDSKGLLFKVRVVSAQVSGREAPPQPKGMNSL